MLRIEYIRKKSSICRDIRAGGFLDENREDLAIPLLHGMKYVSSLCRESHSL